MVTLRPLLQALLKEIDVRPLSRGKVNKRKSAGKFRGNTKRTHSRNMKGPMRGGIRL